MATGLENLRKDVLAANLEIVARGLVLYTFGNASGIDRSRGLVAIKPSGVPYGSLVAEDLVIIDLDGKQVEGTLKPSSDLHTHLHLYRELPEIGGVVHTHSEYATAWAQAGRAIPALGTTHADYFHGPVPVTEELIPAEIEENYVLNTGVAITRALAGTSPLQMPAVLVGGHGPFCWGKTAAEAAHHAVVLETVARMAYLTDRLNPDVEEISKALLDHHHLRKHGSKATYGQ